MIRTFFVVWTGQVFSLFGSGIVHFALAWYLTIRTGSATVLATAGLIELLPFIFLGPLVGAFVDRWNRKWTLIGADTIIAASTAILVVLFITGAVEVWHIYVTMLIRAVGAAFHQPAMSATTPLLLPEKHLARAAGLNQMVNGGMRIVSPLLGALFISIMSMQSVLSIDIITAVIAVGCLLFVTIPQPPRAPEAVRKSALSDMMQGLRYTLSWRGLILLLLGASLLNLCITPAFSLLPILVTKHFGGGAAQLAWMGSAFGAGTIGGGLIISAWGGFKKRMVTSLMGLAGAAIGFFGMGFAPANMLVLGVAANVMVGLSLAFTNAPLAAILQSVIPKNMQGRVFALLGTLTLAASPIGLAAAGPLADIFDVRLWYIIAGVVTLIITFTFACVPDVMNIEKKGATEIISAVRTVPVEESVGTPDEED